MREIKIYRRDNERRTMDLIHNVLCARIANLMIKNFNIINFRSEENLKSESIKGGGGSPMRKSFSIWRQLCKFVFRPKSFQMIMQIYVQFFFTTLDSDANSKEKIIRKIWSFVKTWPIFKVCQAPHLFNLLIKLVVRFEFGHKTRLSRTSSS